MPTVCQHHVTGSTNVYQWYAQAGGTQAGGTQAGGTFVESRLVEPLGLGLGRVSKIICYQCSNEYTQTSIVLGTVVEQLTIQHNIYILARVYTRSGSSNPVL